MAKEEAKGQREASNLEYLRCQCNGSEDVGDFAYDTILDAVSK